MANGETIVLWALGISFLVLFGHIWCSVLAFRTGYKKGHLGQGAHYGLVFGLFGLQKVEGWFQAPHPNYNNDAYLQNATIDPTHHRWQWGLICDGLGIAIISYQASSAVISKSFDYSPVWLWPIGIALILIGWALLKRACPPLHLLHPLNDEDYGEPLDFLDWVTRRWNWAKLERRCKVASELSHLLGWVGAISLIGSFIQFDESQASGFNLLGTMLLVVGGVSITLAIIFLQKKSRYAREREELEFGPSVAHQEASDVRPNIDPEKPGDKPTQEPIEKPESEPYRLEFDYYAVQKRMEEILTITHSRRNDAFIIVMVSIALGSLIVPTWSNAIEINYYFPALMLTAICLAVWLILYWSYRLRCRKAEVEKAEYRDLDKQLTEMSYLLREKEFVEIKAQVAAQPAPEFDFGSPDPLMFERTLIPEAAQIIKEYENSFEEIQREQQAEDDDYHGFVGKIKKIQFARAVLQSLSFGLLLVGCNVSILLNKEPLFGGSLSASLFVFSVLLLVFSFALQFPIHYEIVRSAGCWTFTGVTWIGLFAAVLLDDYFPGNKWISWVLVVGGVSQIVAFLYLAAHIAKTRRR